MKELRIKELRDLIKDLPDEALVLVNGEMEGFLPSISYTKKFEDTDQMEVVLISECTELTLLNLEIQEI